MTIEVSARSRVWFYFSMAALLALAGALASISVRDPDGVWLRLGMILMTVGAAMWLPFPAVILTVPVIWLGPNYLRGTLGDQAVFQTETLLELPGLIGLALTATLTRRQLRVMEEETEALHSFVGLQSEIDQETGVYQERLLKESIERELVRSRRFGREFAVMLAAIDPLRVKFEYRDEEKWDAGVKATAGVLLQTRTHIDRVYRYGSRGFALLLPETGAKDITGLVRRLARSAKKASPPEGEPGGPLPLHFGVTFFPQCATTVDDLLRRAEVALRIAEKNPNRVQIDGAEAADLPPPETLRQEEEQGAFAEALAGGWLGAEAPEEEAPAAIGAVTPPSPRVEQAPVAPIAEVVLAGLSDAAVAEPDEAGRVPAPAAYIANEEAVPLAFREPPAWMTSPVEESLTEAAAEPPLPDARPLGTALSPVLYAEGIQQAQPAGEPAMADAVSGLLEHLDETLALIRSLKAAGANRPSSPAPSPSGPESQNAA